MDLPVEPTHRALDDVKTTVHLFFHLANIGQRDAPIRTSPHDTHAPSFERLRESLEKWSTLKERPGVLVHRILHEGKLLAYYSRKIDKHRLANLEELSHRIAKLDNAQLDPIEATRRALDGASLAREQRPTR